MTDEQPTPEQNDAGGTPGRVEPRVVPQHIKLRVHPNKAAIHEMLDLSYVHEFELHVDHPKAYRDERFDGDGYITLCTPAIVVAKWHATYSENQKGQPPSEHPKTQDDSSLSAERQADEESPTKQV